MATSARTTVRLKLVNHKQAVTVLTALEPEAVCPLNRRTKIGLVVDEEFLIITVVAVDTVALRAAVNTYLRWVGSAVNVLGLLDA